jgi:ABC-type uncharacterized transport system permease subunit
MIHPGVPVCIMALLATVHTLKNDKRKRKEKGKAKVWNFLYDLCPPVLNRAMLMVHIILFSGYWFTLLAILPHRLGYRC